MSLRYELERRSAWIAAEVRLDCAKF